MRYIILLCTLLAFHTNLFAQVANQNALSFPSTDNAFSGKTGAGGNGTNVDVDLYTGSLLANITLCNLTATDLSIPIGLNYTGGHGIKLQQYATCVGLGWQLNAGGSISRVVRGFPDEQPNGFVGGGWGNKIANWSGWAANSSQGNLVTSDYSALLGINTANNSPTADGEPDLFTVQTPFFSFQFVLDGGGNAQVDNNNGYRISYDRSNQDFTVTDDQGNQYFFASNKQSYYGDLESSENTLYNVGTSYVSTWYLDKIVTFNSKETITLNYISGNNGTYYYDTNVYYQFYEVTNFIGTPQLTNNNQTTTVSVPLYVSSIVTSQGEADFSYVWDRQDDANAARLSGITLKAFNPVTGSNSTNLRTYTFNTSYFGSPSTDPNVLRMRLDNVTVTDNTTSNGPITLESFGYNQANVMPARNSGCFDWLGYCSVTSTSQFYTDPTQYYGFVNSVRAPTNLAKTDVLQTISDVYGGNWSISYQLNDYGPSLTPVGGLRVNLLSRTDPVSNQTITRTYTYTDANGYSTGTLYNPNYKYLDFDFNGTFIYFSECPYSTSDLTGSFVGYASVTVTEANGGSTVYGFSNFNSDPDAFNAYMPGSSDIGYQFSSPASMAYRRGLLKTQAVYKKGSTVPLYTITNNYTSWTTPVQAVKAFRPLNMGAVINGNGGSIMGGAIYYTNQDNFRLTSSTRIDYDPVQTGNSVSRTTNYTYVAPNWRLVHSTTTTDSKGNTYTKTFYHPEDGGSIPLVTNPSAEWTTIGNMVNANATNVLIHETDALNSAIHHEHNVYGSYFTGLTTNIYLSQANAYIGPVTSPTLVRQKTYTFDPGSSQLIDVAAPGDKSITFKYGYNNAFPVAQVVNASSSSTFSSSQTTSSKTIMSVPGSTSFTTGYVGTIVLRLMPGSSSTGVNFDLVGPAGENENAVLCAGTNCGAYTTTYTQNNAPVGNYTLSVSGSSPGSSVTVTYPVITTSGSSTAEFFYEGFEQSGAGTTGTAHSGHVFYSNNYTASWSPPNGRAYTIQWWNLLNGAWTFNQQPYSSGMTLTGPVDDIRIFPSDALMTTTTYDPLVGKTSETDPAGHTQTYEYDGLGRLLRARDENGNIVQQYQYGYQTALHQ